MKHEKYDYSGYCGEEDEHVARGKTIVLLAAIAVGAGVWSAFFFVAGYYVGAG